MTMLCWQRLVLMLAVRNTRWGLRECATENAAACKPLLADLIERGLPTERSLLFVIDGAKALPKPITDISRVREMARRVWRWQGGAMIPRWTAAGVCSAALISSHELSL